MAAMLDGVARQLLKRIPQDGGGGGGGSGGSSGGGGASSTDTFVDLISSPFSSEVGGTQRELDRELTH